MNRETNQQSAPSIQTVEQLEDLLSEPTGGAVDVMRRLDGDLILLGVGGKMGPTLARMAKRASDAAGVRRRVIGVSRFSSHEPAEGARTPRPREPASAQAADEASALLHGLTNHGIETIRCDLLDEAQVEKLPDATNVIFMAGMKFGSTGQQALTWAMNSYLPGVICRRYRQSRIVAFSTGNVYGLVPIDSAGSLESDHPSPVGEYAMSCLGRERVFEYFSRTWRLLMSLVRLNYACELRYGVLVDLAQRVWAGDTIDLAMGRFNIIWQGDANAMTLQAFSQISSPPCVLNVTGPEQLSVRQACDEFGRLMNKPVRFTGTESPSAFLSNAQRAHQLFGPPRVRAEELIRWIADWVMRGGETLGKPTHFESRDGKY